VLRILIVPIFGWFLLVDDGASSAARFWATGLFAVAMFTDRVDGDLARRRDMVTDFGKVADPIADKALTGMAFVGLSIIGELYWWITLLVLVREWGVTLLRFVIIRHGVMPAGRGGKLKTLLQAVALGLFILPLWVFPFADLLEVAAWVVMAAAVAVTVVTGAAYVLKAFRLRQGSERTRLKRARARRVTPKK
jgi:CDP-diacylglycerol--glycerol-3-phosphate 3-phosphatidyltransferase